MDTALQRGVCVLPFWYTNIEFQTSKVKRNCQNDDTPQKTCGQAGEVTQEPETGAESSIWCREVCEHSTATWAPLSTAQPAPQTLLPVISPATQVGKGRQNSPHWGQKDGFTTSTETKQAAEFITAPRECCNLRTFFPCMGVSHFSVKHFVLKWVQLLYIRAFSMKS